MMTGHAYEQSAELAGALDPFPGYRDARCAHVSKPVKPDNVDSMLGVIKLHRTAVEEIHPSAEFGYLKEEARRCWDRALATDILAKALRTTLSDTDQERIRAARPNENNEQRKED